MQFRFSASIHDIENKWLTRKNNLVTNTRSEWGLVC